MKNNLGPFGRPVRFSAHFRTNAVAPFASRKLILFPPSIETFRHLRINYHRNNVELCKVDFETIPTRATFL